MALGHAIFAVGPHSTLIPLVYHAGFFPVVHG